MRGATLLASLLTFGIAHADAPAQSYHQLTSGNGFGFSVFDADAKKLTTFLERPYRYLSPGEDLQHLGVYRRDLLHEAYFGLRDNGLGAWVPELDQDEVGYVEQTGVLRSATHLGDLRVESFFFAPYPLAANAMVMIARVTNRGAEAHTVDLFALPDFRLGDGGDDPSPTGETITTDGAISVETGALGDRGGALVYLPLGPIARADCNGGTRAAVTRGQALPEDARSCHGDDRVLVYQSTPLWLGPGDVGELGLIIGFSPAASAAPALASTLTDFVAERSPAQLLSDALLEWARWRRPAPRGISDDERRVYRQAESTLRMAQIREPWSPGHHAFGMILASLPPGIWHIGWVRDATYAIVALSHAGHLDEAHDALRFLLSADAGRYAEYVGGRYRVSVTRYFGDGEEESDWNADGPNIEMDGWGLTLWALRQYLDAAGDGAFLDERLPTGVRVRDALRSGVAAPIARNQEADGLIGMDTSIWESHWSNRKHYAFTSLAAARGLCDLAAVESSYGDRGLAADLTDRASRVRQALRHRLLDESGLLGGSQEGIAGGTYHDGAVLDAFNWEIFAPSDPICDATLRGLDDKLRLAAGGYERNDDNGSRYDSDEWAFVDLRMAGAQRRAGQAPRADELIARVTTQARANFDLIPELYNAFADAGPLGAYAGATPMVGFGAGAYLLALEARAGQREDHGCAALTRRPVDGSTRRLTIAIGALIALMLAALVAGRRG